MELKSGLELHQQLNTRKLFCECPSVLRSDNPEYVINRRMHPVPGESGEVDEAARFESLKKTEFIYECYKDNVCLVDLDEEPCHDINKEALGIALKIALLLNCEIIPYTQIMRKTVIDGSNTSGFQRTALIAKNGYIETTSGRVGIATVCLEEDSARIIKQEKNRTIYRLDRLGIPLIEIATDPDIKTAIQAKEVALHLGEILRACNVKRGIGTIRQDVNLSIEGGKRIEIKGVQEPALIQKTIEIEVERQKELVKKGNSVAEVRKANPDGTTTFLRPMPGAARMYPETDLPLLYISRDFINEVKKGLPRLKSELRQDLEKQGLNQEMIKLILEENKLEDYKTLLNVYKNPNLIAKLLVLWPREIAVKEKISEKKLKELLHLDILELILDNVRDKKIDESHARAILTDIAKGKSVSEALKIEKADEKVEEEILKIVKEKPGLSINAYMGLAMQRFKGKVSGKDIMEILKRIIK
ncbi:Glu-tRNA(Gln) amidotransferase subunit GatE [Candidatus Pacearchaeota archaeon]|nr:Glu-tRNA(Gln) amidotransferase subunit GatE [Candidatus Pacearchaeota archaeon]